MEPNRSRLEAGQAAAVAAEASLPLHVSGVWKDLVRGRTVRLAIWAKRKPRGLPRGVSCFTPEDVLGALR